jgi:carbon starvation protein
MIFMLIVPAWAMLSELPKWLAAENPNWVVIGVGIATLVLEAWMLVEAVILWPRVKGVLEIPAQRRTIAPPIASGK